MNKLNSGIKGLHVCLLISCFRDLTSTVPLEKSRAIMWLEGCDAPISFQDVCENLFENEEIPIVKRKIFSYYSNLIS